VIATENEYVLRYHIAEDAFFFITHINGYKDAEMI
jgi:hypothetical protein